jgi:hypothetical protein
MLKIILIAIAAALAALLAYAATKPDTFSVQRSHVIGAAPEKLYALIVDMKAFNTWNPWLRKDPTSPLRYEGPQSGVGAAYAWDSKALGAGRMEVTEVAAPAKAAMRLDFLRPMTSTNRVDFTLEPQGAQTRVTWKMSGPMPYLSKLMSVFFDMDKMIGPDFEAGLANLKAEAEKKS